MPSYRTGLVPAHLAGAWVIIRDMTSVPDRARVRLTGISSRAYEHPADRSALVALRKLSGFDTLLRKLFGLFNERAFRLTYLGGRRPRLRAPVPAHLRAGQGRFLHPGPRRGARGLRDPEPAGERDGAGPGQAVHRDHHRHGQPVRPGGAPLGGRARARPHPVRARGLPHHAADPAPAGGAGRLPADHASASGPSSGAWRSGSASPSSPATGPGCWPGRTWTRPGGR